MDTFRQVPPAAAAAVTAPWLPPVCLLSISAGRASERMRRRRERGREGGREVKLDLSVLVDQDGSSYLMMQTKSNVTFRSYGGRGSGGGALREHQQRHIADFHTCMETSLVTGLTVVLLVQEQTRLVTLHITQLDAYPPPGTGGGQSMVTMA